MKRIGYSFLGGTILSAIIFFICVVASFGFADFGGPPGSFNTMQKIVTFPLIWSTYLGENMFPQTYKNIGQTVMLTYYVAGCNILLYSVLVYLFFPLLKVLKEIGRSEIKSSEPPEPPIFE